MTVCNMIVTVFADTKILYNSEGEETQHVRLHIVVMF